MPLREQMTDRRESVRRSERGMALLKPAQLNMPPVTGVLIDSSQNGFRVRHLYAGFEPGQIASYIHRVREGMARATWHRATDAEFETGLEYLDVRAGRSCTAGGA